VALETVPLFFVPVRGVRAEATRLQGAGAGRPRWGENGG